jgi:broad specificity phosphatase PhoE
MTERRWPDRLWIVRHGESAGNVARDAAYASGLHVIDMAHRDVDVPLSVLGERQSQALGAWFAAMSERDRPSAVLTSPFLRARETAAIIARAGGHAPDATTIVDERLREKEFGILDRLTKTGIERHHPEQAALRARMGKFYFRPPGGESWCDVILRLRSVLDTVSLHHSQPDSRLLIVAHQVIVLCLRYLLEDLNEQEILAIDRAGEVANCGVTSYVLDPGSSRGGRLRLETYNVVVPLVASGTPVTSRPDEPAGAK